MRLLLPTLLGFSWLTLAHGYVFDVTSAICTQVLWSVVLTPAEWVLCNTLEFYVRDPLRINPPQTLRLTCAVGGDVSKSGYTSFRTPVTESPNQRSWEIGAAVIGYDGNVLSDSASVLNFFETWQVGNCPTPTVYSNPVVSTPISTTTRPYTSPIVPPTRTVTPTPRPSPCSECKKAINIAAIAGGVVGGLVALTVLTLLVWLLCRRKRARKAEAAQNARIQSYSASSMGGGGMSPDEKAFSLNDARPLSGVPSLPLSGSATPSQGTYGSPYMAPMGGVAAAVAATSLSSAPTQEDPTMSPSNTQASYPTQVSASVGLASPPLSPLLLANSGTGMAAGSSVGGFTNARPTTAGSTTSGGASYFDAPVSGAASTRPNPLLGAMPAWSPSGNMPAPEPMTSPQPETGATAGQNTATHYALLNEPMSSAQQY